MVKFITAQERQQVVDKTFAAQIDLPLASFDEAENGRISFDQLSRGLTLRISCFEGQRVGADLIVGVYGDSQGVFWNKRLKLESDDTDTLILIPADDARTFRGQTLTLNYVYELQYISPDATYLAEADIYDPVVDEAVQDVIPLRAVNGGINLRLRASDALSSGALVSVYMHGSTCDACLVRHFQLEMHDDGKDVVVRVEPRFLQPNKYGSVRLIYTVEKAGRRWITSMLELLVEGDLKTPEPAYFIPGFCYDDILEPVEGGGPIPFSISTDGMGVGDALTFIFAGKGMDSSFILRQTLAPHQIGLDLKINVPIAQSQLNGGANVMTIVERVNGDTVGSPLRYLVI
ncbi:hypothetical protein [Pseudomonas sp. HS6]|uniref:hypothetical protein n=1 Tax=Pseudomonas sp. HS6 TaxID=2850559 RepID=UPI002019E23A|nr:hypothetical protein [Pseudomonas sp. HS6]UQS12874.1 hypothetical protein JJN09_16720 [Pseudomonas sp. HS6]